MNRDEKLRSKSGEILKEKEPKNLKTASKTLQIRNIAEERETKDNCDSSQLRKPQLSLADRPHDEAKKAGQDRSRVSQKTEETGREKNPNSSNIRNPEAFSDSDIRSQGDAALVRVQASDSRTSAFSGSEFAESSPVKDTTHTGFDTEDRDPEENHLEDAGSDSDLLYGGAAAWQTKEPQATDVSGAYPETHDLPAKYPDVFDAWRRPEGNPMGTYLRRKRLEQSIRQKSSSGKQLKTKETVSGREDVQEEQDARSSRQSKKESRQTSSRTASSSDGRSASKAAGTGTSGTAFKESGEDSDSSAGLKNRGRSMKTSKDEDGTGIAAAHPGSTYAMRTVGALWTARKQAEKSLQRSVQPDSSDPAGTREGSAAKKVTESLKKVFSRQILGIYLVILPMTGVLLLLIMMVLICAGVLFLYYGGGYNSSGSTVSNTTAYTEVSDEVEQYDALIRQYAKLYGISDYVDLIKAVMMQESGGLAADVMQASASGYNTTGEAITDAEYSIDVGVHTLADCLTLAGVESIVDIANIRLALQGYNYGSGYITWALANFGGYTYANAIAYAELQCETYGYESYGDSQYVLHVLRYYPYGRSSTSTEATGTFLWPCDGGTITSYFGSRTAPTEGASTDHKGIDIAASEGTQIYASDGGTVSVVSYSGSAGYYVIIDHGNGFTTKYQHCSQIIVAEGETVSQGQIIAYVGSTGISTGAHLHFQIELDGVAVDPLDYLSY